MPHEVIMPQLGMSQDKGLILAWRKAVGDPVAADEILMEVETDKAAMDVPAGVDGVLVEIRAEAGTEAPVGQIIAIVADDSGTGLVIPAGGKEERAAAQTGPTPTESVPASSSGALPASAGLPPMTASGSLGATPASGAPVSPRASMPGAPAAGLDARPQGTARRSDTPVGRVLASPKARRAARDRGIDLVQLVRQGVREPIHVRDLDRAPGDAAALNHLAARVKRSAFDALLSAAGESVDRPSVFAAFAAGAYRTQVDGRQILVDCQSHIGCVVSLVDPDRSGLLSLSHDPECGPPALMVVDLARTRLSSYLPAAVRAPTVCIGADGDDYALSLAFMESDLPFAKAVAFLDNLAARIEEPIRQLL